jgi:serine/threonine-protein kinase
VQPEPATADDPRLHRDSTVGGDATLAAQPGKCAVGAVEPAQSLDNHLLEEAIGHGGMGVVFRAWDPVLKRHVALKKIRSGVLAGEAEVERFYREARAAAQLQHPNVVPIHGMGMHQGEHCFTMALAPTTLEKRKKRYQADVRAAVALVEAVARGVQAAHDKGIIHRDLKPANILLDDKGQPLVSDFGLAKSLDVAAHETMPGMVKGTPYYMAPEAAAGRTWEVGKASDVWALGVILYELLTGQRPFEGETAEDILPQVLEREPPRPRQLRPSLDRGLETILDRCLEKEPSWRYPSAAALAADLGCWLNNRPIQPRRSRQQTKVRPSRPSAGARKALVLLLVFLLGAGGWLLIRPPATSRPDAPEPTPEQRALEAIQRDLAAGKSVTLVGREGLPAWYAWRTEKNRPPLPQRMGPLYVESWGCCQVELLPAAPPRFQLRAEVKFGKTIDGAAGLYFLGEERLIGNDKRPLHSYVAFTVSGPPRAPDQVRLVLACYREPSLDRKFEFHDFPLRRVSFPRGLPGTTDGWCKLIVDVTPEVLTVRLGETLFQTLPRRDQGARVRAWWQVLYGSRTASPPAFPPQGGLGLFVSQAGAHFRNVVVEPLRKP